MTDQPEAKPQDHGTKELSGRVGKYDIVRPIGKGAMGMVYLAHDTILERDVALKVMVAQIADDPELKKRFEREAKAVARMTHPNVVMVFDLGSLNDGSPFIAMELLKGQDLQKAMRTPPPLPLERKVSIIVQVLAGLAHAHQAGIIHRDIKPANIFLNADGAVKIMDFGVARLTTASMTGTGNIVGTADYMSPEQVKGAHVDGRSDVFSVGCMLYELLAGRRPFHSENLMAIFYKITHDEPDFSLVPEGGDYDGLLPILKKALAKSLDERYATAYEFAVDLRDYLRAHATTSSGAHALEGLLEAEPPTSPPQPLTDAPLGPTFVPGDDVTGPGATVGIGARRGTGATAPGGATARPAAAPTVSGSRPTVLAPRSAPTRILPTAQAPGRARPEPRSSGLLFAALGGGVLVLVVAAGAYVYINSTPKPTPAPPPPPSPIVVVATPTPAVPTPLPSIQVVVHSPVPPPPSASPKTVGQSPFLRSAQAAYRTGDYDRAIQDAQSVLKEDPGNPEAKRIVESSLQGQRAEEHFRTAENALRSNDLNVATSEAQTGAAIAPWDARGPALIRRIEDMRNKASSVQQERVAALLDQADTEISNQKFDAAIAHYEDALKLDPRNAQARQGRATAIQLKALHDATRTTGRDQPTAGRTCAEGKTEARPGDKGPGQLPPEFEPTAGVNVHVGTQAASLPGKINFEVEPASLKPGDKYAIKAFLRNEGNAPIQIRQMVVTSTFNGRRSSGPVPPLVKDVAPAQRALLREFPDVWKEGTNDFKLEVQVSTVRGEIYSNGVVCR